MAFPSLANENSSVYSLTFEEFQNILGDPGAKFGSMNMDELLRNIWTAEENQAAMAFEGSNTTTTTGMNGGFNANCINNTGIVSQLSIQRLGSLCLPRTLSTRTVEEVWRSLQTQPEIREGEENINGNVGLQTRQITLGEVIIEDFLVKAGLVQKPPIPQEENQRLENGKSKKEEGESSSSSRQFVGPTISSLMGGCNEPNIPSQVFNFQLDQSLLRSPHNQQVQRGYHQMNVNLPFVAQPHQQQLPKEASDARASSPHNQSYHQMNVPFLTQQQHQQAKEAPDARSGSPHQQQAQQGYHQMNMNVPFITQHLPPKEASDVRAISPHHQQAQQGFHPLSVSVPFVAKQPLKESSDVGYGGAVIETSPRPLSTTTMGGVLSNTGATGVWLSGMRYGVATSPVSSRTEDSSPTCGTNGQATCNGRKRCSEAPVEKVIERRQRRMIKNRESAARSRARKQAYTMELEAEVSHLKEENMKLLQKQEEADRKKKQVIGQTPLIVKAGGRISSSSSSSSSSSLRRTCTGPW